MADVHVQKTGAEDGVPQAEEVVVVPDVRQADEKPAAVAKESLLVPENGEEPVKPKQVEEAAPLETTEMSKPKGGVEKVEKVPQSGSFKEESSRVADLFDNEKKALEELKSLVQEALNKHEFYGPVAKPEEQPIAAAEQETEVAVTEDAKEEPKDDAVSDEPKVESEAEKETVAEANDGPVKEENIIEEKVAAVAGSDTVEDDGAKTVEAIEETIVSVSSSVQPEQEPAADGKADDAVLEDQAKKAKTEDDKVLPPEEVSIWGIPLLADERSDVVLLKFLRARDFKVKEAFAMLKNTIRWRKEFGIDELVEQDLGDDLEKVVFMHGFDKEGHPVCYNVYGEFQSKELYQKTFSDEEKRQNFLRWRIQFLEKSIRKLDFSPGGICTIVQVNDLKNSPGPAKWELRQATKQALQLLQDNYPEFVARQVFRRSLEECFFFFKCDGQNRISN